MIIEDIINFDQKHFENELIWDFSFQKFLKINQNLEKKLLYFFEDNKTYLEWKNFFINNINYIDDFNIKSHHLNIRQLSIKDTLLLYDKCIGSINFESLNYKKKYIRDFFINNLIIKKELNLELIDFLDFNKIDYSDEFINSSNQYPQLAIKTNLCNEYKIISNFDIKKILVYQCIYDYLQYYTVNNFLIFQIDIAIGQAGALIIVDLNNNKICFSHRDEGFNLNQRLEYSIKKDEFYGKFYWDHPMTHVAGDGSFVITKNRKLQTQNYNVVNESNHKVSGIGKLFDDEFEK